MKNRILQVDFATFSGVRFLHLGDDDFYSVMRSNLTKSCWSYFYQIFYLFLQKCKLFLHQFQNFLMDNTICNLSSCNFYSVRCKRRSWFYWAGCLLQMSQAIWKQWSKRPKILLTQILVRFKTFLPHLSLGSKSLSRKNSPKHIDGQLWRIHISVATFKNRRENLKHLGNSAMPTVEIQRKAKQIRHRILKFSPPIKVFYSFSSTSQSTANWYCKFFIEVNSVLSKKFILKTL